MPCFFPYPVWKLPSLNYFQIFPGLQINSLGCTVHPNTEYKPPPLVIIAGLSTVPLPNVAFLICLLFRSLWMQGIASYSRFPERGVLIAAMCHSTKGVFNYLAHITYVFGYMCILYYKYTLVILYQLCVTRKLVLLLRQLMC